MKPQNLVIQTSTERDIPWELTYDGEEFWCMKYNIGRALGTEDETGVSETPAPQTTMNIAIISNPDGSLEGASNEAQLIKSHLEKDEQIKVEIFNEEKATKLNILSIITSGNYDVIHYTGHAQFSNVLSEEPSFLQLHDNNLTSNEIMRLKFNKSCRPIIFANGCSTSATKFVGDKTVGLATAFIIAGALAYIGTMWPVQDNYAAKFAGRDFKFSIGTALQRALLSCESV